MFRDESKLCVLLMVENVLQEVVENGPNQPRLFAQINVILIKKVIELINTKTIL